MIFFFFFSVFTLGKVVCYLFIYLFIMQYFLQKFMAKSIVPPTIKTQYNPPQQLFERPLRAMFVKTGRLLRCSDIVETAKKKTNYTFLSF